MDIKNRKYAGGFLQLQTLEETGFKRRVVWVFWGAIGVSLTTHDRSGEHVGMSVTLFRWLELDLGVTVWNL
jgi:hypothetical protein